MILPVMECTYCCRKMHRFFVMTVKPIAPIVCNKCGEINMMLNGKSCRKFSADEWEGFKKSPIGKLALEYQQRVKERLTKGEIH